MFFHGKICLFLAATFSDERRCSVYFSRAIASSQHYGFGSENGSLAKLALESSRSFFHCDLTLKLGKIPIGKLNLYSIHFFGAHRGIGDLQEDEIFKLNLS